MRSVIVAIAVALGTAQTLGWQAPPPGGRPGQGTPQPPPPLVTTGLIVGRVIDPATGRGVAGALVMISGGAMSAPVRVTPGTPRPAPPPPPPRYLTDSEGRFAFRHLTRGSYVITATKQGYADGAHGRLRPNGPTRPLLLGDGERVGEVLIRLFKLGAVSGTVLDEAGEPVVGVSLRAYRRVLMAGRRVFTPFGGNATTDDRGMYRLSNLTPGEYAISVPMVSTTMPTGFTPDSRMAPNFDLTMFVPGTTGVSFGGGGRQVTADGRFLLQTGSPNASTAGAIAEPDGRLRTSPTMFYAAARTIAEAQVVQVGSGDERSGVDIVLPLVPASNVSGQLLSPEGPASGYAVHLVPADADDLSVDPPVASAVTAADGTFMFIAVPAGQYRLQTTRVPRPGPPPPPPPPPPPGVSVAVSGRAATNWVAVPMPPASTGPMLWASMPIALGEADIDGLVVMLQEGLKVSGRVEFDGSAERPQGPRLTQVPVILEAADGKQRVNQSTPGRVQADGRFTAGGVLPGKYFLRVGGSPPGWTFRSAMLNGVDVSDAPFVLDKDLSGVILNFTDRPTELMGTVSLPSGQLTEAAVVIFPADTDAWKEFGINSRRMRMGRAGSGGTVALGSPPPGEYFVVAFREEYAIEWQDPRFLEQLARVAARLTLGEGERKTVDVPFHDVRPGGGGDETRERESFPLNSLEMDPDPFSSGPFVPDGPQIRDRPAEPRGGNGSISGVVVLDGASTPVRRARVSVSSSETRTQRVAITDDAGRFTIAWLPPGRYTMLASKPAHLTSYYGERRIGRGPGTPIVVASGQQVTGISVTMQRGGVVSGIVLDAYGQPYAGARVRLLRYVTRDGERVLQQTGASGPGMTDDRGAYRLYGILPGSYVVSVAVAPGSTASEIRQLSSEEMNAALNELRQSPSATLLGESGMQTAAPGRAIAPGPPGPPPPATPAGRPLGYASFYYPGTPMEHEAVTVAIAAGQEVGGIDIPMRLVPTARIEGTLLTPDGQPAARASMSLVSSSAGSTTSSSIRMYPDGRFQAFSVPPGRYTLTARLMETPAPRPAPVPGAPPTPPIAMSFGEAPRLTLWAQQEIDVNGEDVKDLSLRLQDAMSVSGRVVFEAHTEKLPADPGLVRVSLEPLTANRLGFSARPATLDRAGNFTITGVTPGRYRLNATVSTGSTQPQPAVQVPGTGGPAAPRWMVKSAIMNGRNTVDLPVDIGSGEHVTGAVVTLTDQITELSGTIVDAAGKLVPDLTVVLFSTDRTFWTMSSRRVRAPYRATDGKFRMTALLPGEYFLAVVTDVAPEDWGDRQFMEQLAAASIKITLAEGEKKVQDVRIGG